MEGKSLEQIITESGSGDIVGALDNYFETSFMPPRSVLTKDAINILLNQVRKCPEFVPWAVKCFDDFISNQEIQREWLDYSKELSQLWRACLDDDKIFEVHSGDICRIFMILGEKGEPLSSTLFNMCAAKFFELVDCGSVQIGTSSLSVLTTLCRFAEYSNIARTLELWAYQLNKLAKRSIHFPVEAQVNVYMILIKSICSKEDAEKNASLWFDQWPNIQRTIFNYYPDKIAEGCGEFLHELLCLSEETRNPTTSTKEPGEDIFQLEPVTCCNEIDEPTGSLYDDVLKLFENSGKEIRLEESAAFNISNNFPEQPESFGIEPSMEILYPEPVAHCTSIEEPSHVSDVTDNSDSISKISKKQVAERFTLRNNLSSMHLHRSPIQIGADLAFPVEPPKRLRSFNYINGKWCFNIKKFSDVSSKERWPSFKWNSGKK